MATPPEMIVVGGPNGAGKTTFAEQFITDFDYRYLGADAIAAQIAPDDPSSVQFEASREFLYQLQEEILSKEDLVVESTLSGRTFQSLIKSAKSQGYEVSIHFIWVDSPDTSVARVKERVQKGGHDVPEKDIRRRFFRSIDNFWNRYRLLSDHWFLSYNAKEEAREVAIGTATEITIRDDALFAEFQRMIPTVP